MGVYSLLNCTGFAMQLTPRSLPLASHCSGEQGKGFHFQVPLRYPSKPGKMKIFSFSELGWKGEKTSQAFF